MRMRHSMLAAGLALVIGVGASMATAGNPFRGKEAPPIKPNSWVGSNGRSSLADYKGEVVLLDFWFSH